MSQCHRVNSSQRLLSLSIHRSVSCLRRGVLWMPMGFGAEASNVHVTRHVLFGCPARSLARKLARKPLRVPASLGLQVIWCAPPPVTSAFVTGTPPIWCGALRDLAFVKGTRPIWCNLVRGPSVAWLLSRGHPSTLARGPFWHGFWSG